MKIRMPALFAAFKLLVTELSDVAYNDPEYGALYMLVGRWKSPNGMPGADSEVRLASTVGATGVATAGADSGVVATGSVAGAVDSSGLQASTANTRAEQARARRRAPWGARLNR